MASSSAELRKFMVEEGLEVERAMLLAVEVEAPQDTSTGWCSWMPCGETPLTKEEEAEKERIKKEEEDEARVIQQEEQWIKITSFGEEGSRYVSGSSADRLQKALATERTAVLLQCVLVAVFTVCKYGVTFGLLLGAGASLAAASAAWLVSVFLELPQLNMEADVVGAHGKKISDIFHKTSRRDLDCWEIEAEEEVGPFWARFGIGCLGRKHFSTTLLVEKAAWSWIRQVSYTASWAALEVAILMLSTCATHWAFTKNTWLGRLLAGTTMVGFVASIIPSVLHDLGRVSVFAIFGWLGVAFITQFVVWYKADDLCLAVCNAAHFAAGTLFLLKLSVPERKERSTLFTVGILFLGIAFGFLPVLTTNPLQWASDWGVVLPDLVTLVIGLFHGELTVVFLEVPTPIWPTYEEQLQFSLDEKADRVHFYCTFFPLFISGCLTMGTLMMCSPARRRSGASAPIGLVLPWLTRLVVSLHVVLSLKLMVSATWAGTLSPITGLCFEGYAQLLFGGGSWTLLQASVLMALLPNLKWGIGAFPSAFCASTAPFLSDAFDTAKDSQFSALALAAGSKLSKAIGTVSLAWLLFYHVAALTWWEDLFAELQTSFCAILAAPLPPQPRKKKAVQDKGCWQPFFEKVLWVGYGQTRPAKVNSVMKEDLPQAGMAVSLTFVQPVPPIVLALNVAMPSLRICAGKLAYPLLAPRVRGLLFQKFSEAAAMQNFVALAEWAREWCFTLHGLPDGSLEISFGTWERLILAKVPADEYVSALSKFSVKLETLEQWHSLLRSMKVVYTGPDLARVVKAALKLTSGLITELTLPEKRIGSKEVKNLVDPIRLSPSAKWLRLSKRLIGYRGMIPADFLIVDYPLGRLDFSEKEIGDAGANVLAESIKGLTWLHELLLPYNQIGDAGAKALADSINDCSSLQTLDFGSNQIGDAGAKSVADWIKVSSSLQVLWLSYNNVGSAGAKSLADSIRVNSSLQELYLCGNQIGQDGVKALQEAKEQSSSLKCLFLDGNPGSQKVSLGTWEGLTLANLTAEDCLTFLRKASTKLETTEQWRVLQTKINSAYNGDDLVQVVAAALKLYSGPMMKLDLQNKELKDSGATALADSIKGSTSLQMLCLGGNQIAGPGAIALADLIKASSSLQALFLPSNNIGDAGAIALADSLKVSSTLQKLCLLMNNIRDTGAKALAEAIRVSSSLHSLRLLQNQIGDPGAIALADAIKVNTSLCTLNLWGNKIDKDGVKALQEAQEQSSSLQYLVLQANPGHKQEDNERGSQ